jgi:hypothetical protein
MVERPPIQQERRGLGGTTGQSPIGTKIIFDGSARYDSRRRCLKHPPSDRSFPGLSGAAASRCGLRSPDAPSRIVPTPTPSRYERARIRR